MSKVKKGDKLWIVDCTIREGTVIENFCGQLDCVVDLEGENTKQFRAMEIDYQNKAIDLMIAKLNELKEQDNGR